MYKLLLFLVFVALGSTTFSQLKPGFQKAEYMELLKVNFRFADTLKFPDLPEPKRFHLKYRSPVVGTDNRWDFWEDKDGIGVISVRGSTSSKASWLSNFYSAMVPASGWMKISATDTFRYQLVKDPKATVHIGWLLSTGFIVKDLLPKLDEFIASGKRDLFIIGHSQGGGISYLLTAHLRSLQQQGRLPKDLRIKTYCSAAPKPGNLFFAYGYESMTQFGWAYNVVNAADWVPESPFTLYTTNDFNATNPFKDAKKSMKSIPFLARLYIKSAYNKMNRPAKKAQRRFEKYFGKKVGAMIKKSVPGFEPPEYVHSNAYARAGNYITLIPDADYYAKFPDFSDSNKFLHHSIRPYLFLMERLKVPEENK